MVNGKPFDQIQWEINQPFFNEWAMINRNFLLLLFIGMFAWLAAYSFEKALVWAELTKQEALTAQEEALQQEQVATLVAGFLQEVVTVFAEQANGRTTYLTARTQHNDPLTPYVYLLNERLRRFEHLRRQESWEGIQTQQAAKALSTTLHKIAVQILPIQSISPTHFRTGVDVIDEIANQIYILLYHQSQAHWQKPPTPPSTQK